MLNGELFIGTVYLAGLLSFFSPCIFPLLPVYLGMLSNNGKKSMLKTSVFILGLSGSFILLGFSVGSLGQFLMSKIFRIMSGIFIILFGSIQAEIIKIHFLEKTKLLEVKKREENSIIGAFLLGFTFSLGWTPCVGPILASILLLSSDGGTPVYGAFMMLVYVVGLATPFLLFSFVSDKVLKKVSKIKKYLPALKKIGGVLIIIMGILFLTDKLEIFGF